MGDWPARYEIRVTGDLDPTWSEWFGVLQIRNREDETILTGVLPDQPALHGVLDKIRDLGLDITLVTRLSEEDGPPRQGGRQ